MSEKEKLEVEQFDNFLRPNSGPNSSQQVPTETMRARTTASSTDTWQTQVTISKLPAAAAERQSSNQNQQRRKREREGSQLAYQQ